MVNTFVRESRRRGATSFSAMGRVVPSGKRWRSSVARRGRFVVWLRRIDGRLIVLGSVRTVSETGARVEAMHAAMRLANERGIPGAVSVQAFSRAGRRARRLAVEAGR